MQFLVNPNAVYKPKDGKDDPDVLAAWNDMNTLPTPEGRQAAFARMQKLVLERGLCGPVRVVHQGAGDARQRAKASCRSAFPACRTCGSAQLTAL